MCENTTMYYMQEAIATEIAYILFISGSSHEFGSSKKWLP